MLFISCPLIPDPFFIYTCSYGIHFFLLMPLFYVLLSSFFFIYTPLCYPSFLYYMHSFI
ncbi:hypothetical protein BDC45DRAFT_529074, partial [Circinella umbellata]